jgi:hypothetical protein
MSYRRRESKDARLGPKLLKSEWLAAISSIRLTLAIGSIPTPV